MDQIRRNPNNYIYLYYKSQIQFYWLLFNVWCVTILKRSEFSAVSILRFLIRKIAFNLEASIISLEWFLVKRKTYLFFQESNLEQKYTGFYMWKVCQMSSEAEKSTNLIAAPESWQEWELCQYFKMMNGKNSKWHNSFVHCAFSFLQI